jgi:hypothetical protein
VFFGVVAGMVDYRTALFCTGFLFAPAVVLALVLPKAAEG